MSTIYQSILKKRGFRELPYQKDFLTNPIYETTTKPQVLAAGTSSGKTFMAIMKLEIFYSNPSNKNKRTLLIPASRTVLRDNVAKELEDFNPSFTYCVATNKTELLAAIKNNCNVIVALPQTVIKNVNSLTKFHNFILDEAHQWYFKPTIQTILKRISVKYQLLLTGTPSRFIAKENQFSFKFVPVMELFDLKQVSNVQLEVVTSSYDFKQSDYLSSYGNLKSNVKMSSNDSDKALRAVCKEMIRKLENPIKGSPNFNRITNNVFSIFGHLEKTIIFCHSKAQANAFFKSLNSFKGLKDKVLVSHSENDKSSQLFEQFRIDSNIKVLIAVDRGRLGYNIPELFNVVDFTMTQSLDMLLQMYGRLLRLSKTNKQKVYYKVANKNDAAYNIVLMTAMFSLTTMEWYSKFNGKNMGQIEIPKTILNKVKIAKQNTSNPKSKSKSKRAISLEALDIPLNLKLFKQSIIHTNDDKFATIGVTTLDDVRREFFNINSYNQFNSLWNKETLLNEAFKYNRKSDFAKNSQGAVQAAKRLGIYEEVCSHMDKNNIGKKTKLSDKEALNEFKRLKKTYTSKKDVREKDQTMFNVLTRKFPIEFKQWYNSLKQLKRHNAYTEKEIRQLAKKYPTRKLMQENGHAAAIRHAVINGYADNIFKHGTKKWTKELIIKELKKYKNKQDIRLNNPALRGLAKRYELWNQIPNKKNK